MKQYFVYMLRCADQSLYTGFTTDPIRRLKTHNLGKGAKYTKSRRPVSMVYLEIHDDKHEALSREARIKQLKKVQKEALLTSPDNKIEEYLKK